MGPRWSFPLRRTETAPMHPPDSPTPSSAPSCPLCGAHPLVAFALREGRRYHRCPVCALVSMDPGDHLDPVQERARYDTHNNDPRDRGYRDFLDRLAAPLAARLPPGAQGLDYGAGPGPTLSLMMTERGFPTRIWDPFFAPDPEALGQRYDFVTCTETMEHFHRPGEEFLRLDGLLRPGGFLGVMTGILHPDVDFATWWYVRDPTHVAFYTPRSLEWIASRHRWELEVVGPGAVLFRKG